MNIDDADIPEVVKSMAEISQRIHDFMQGMKEEFPTLDFMYALAIPETNKKSSAQALTNYWFADNVPGALVLAEAMHEVSLQRCKAYKIDPQQIKHMQQLGQAQAAQIIAALDDDNKPPRSFEPSMS